MQELLTETLTSSISNTLHKTLLEQRKIFLWGVVEDNTSKEVIEQLAYLEAVTPGTPIHLYINSPGGVVTAGFAMHDMMQAISSPVYTYCIGFTASMGSVLLSAGEKGHRYIYPMAEVMIHQPSIGSFRAHSIDIEINARQIIKTKEIIADILAGNCGKTQHQVMKDFDRDYWMNAKEAVDYGIIDKIVTP
ncbi:MAG: ATP-dependent Clp protease proteolytic subunit [Chitinophagales bacterium]|nr:ATP-dependent Clp protease proteolytic subunit [Chitinophagales bacterium]